MRHHALRSGFHRQAITRLLIATVIVSALAAPLGLRSASAQDDFSVQTRVMILHASPDLGKVEVFINNDEVLDEFEYGDLSDWIDFDPGSVRLTITYDRAGFNYAAFDAVYPVPAGNDYYVVMTDAIVMTSVVDRSPVDGGSARVRVAQGAVDLPAIDVKVTPGDIELATDLTYPRSTEYESIPPGTYDIEVTLSATGESVMTQSGVVLDGNTVYDLVIIGELGDDDKPLEIRTLSDTTIGQADATPTS